MKRTYLLALICTSLCSSLISQELAKISSDVNSIEDKVKRLEQDSGLDIRKETTTFLLFGEFIYWKTSLDGVAYATTAVVDVGPTGDNVLNKFKTRTVHFDYSPAFQIGFGIGLPHDHWDISALWLRSFTKGTDTAHGDLSVTPGSKLILDSIGVIEGLNAPPNKAKADCNVHLNVFDLVLGRTFLWSRYFWFRPYAGVRGAWLKLDWDISFKMPISIPSASDQSSTDLDVRNKYFAGGFVGGFESKWNFFRGLGLFSHASASLIFGESSEKTKQEFFSIPANGTELFEQTLTAHNSTHAVKGIFDIQIGVKWEGNFYKENRILVWAGYDFFYWPNVTQKTIYQFNRLRDRADLSYQGLTAGARVVF